ncbi:hypothetical protein [Algoriphagus yeomjeoni]|uniref:O-antigen ligase-related domain-containing protein n=1 Tax=Algoriphagus yeomjeoni TaxID=291403 RepID=A0A327PB97_9BACT|nr:hypothetical protein [Algoriphagus yeomjeoni]RAI89525.1 hypothetical protein LV83_02567 [Algoriphagus yeomjeoni]
MFIFFNSLKQQNKSFFWFIVHVLLGASATISAFPMIIYFYVFLGYSFINLFNVNATHRARLIAEIIIYFASFEGLGRLAGSDPFIPYELGKYIILFLCPLGILLSRNYTAKGMIGLVILILSIPAVLFDESNQVSFNDIKFNILGLLNIGVAIWFFSTLNLNLKTLINWSKPLVYPIVSALVFTIIRTPNLDEVEFTLGANFATAGGFGSNQVSTILGLGVFVFSLAVLLNYRISGFKWLDGITLGLFTIQGLLTFSRGGMIGGFFGVFVVMFYLTKLSFKERSALRIPNFKKYIVPVGILLFIVMFAANLITGGMLLLRYMGETQGTLAGSAEKNLNKITTNRSDIFMEDVDLFLDHTMLGVGVGASSYLRDEYKGYAPHVELSRLIAEHGALGLIIFFLFILVFFLNKGHAPESISKGILIALFLMGFLATFHSATRTYITPLLMGISCVNIASISKKNKKERRKVSVKTVNRFKYQPLDLDQKVPGQL